MNWSTSHMLLCQSCLCTSQENAAGWWDHLQEICDRNWRVRVWTTARRKVSRQVRNFIHRCLWNVSHTSLLLCFWLHTQDHAHLNWRNTCFSQYSDAWLHSAGIKKENIRRTWRNSSFATHRHSMLMLASLFSMTTKEKLFYLIHQRCFSSHLNSWSPLLWFVGIESCDFHSTVSIECIFVLPR